MRFDSFPYQHTIPSHPFSLALFPSHVHTHTQEREEEVQSLPLDEDGEGSFDLSLTNLKMFSLNLQGAERQTPICCSAVPFTPALITCLAALERTAPRRLSMLDGVHLNVSETRYTIGRGACHSRYLKAAPNVDRTHNYRLSIKTVDEKNNNC